MSNNGLNYVGQLIDNNKELKDWEIIKLEFNLDATNWLYTSILEKKYYGWQRQLNKSLYL